MSHEKFDFAIIVALDEEAKYFANVVRCQAANSLLQAITYQPIDDPRWQSFGTGVLISAGAKGVDAAQAAAAAAVEKFKVTSLINIGIAGRVDPDLRIGDVIVPSICFDPYSRRQDWGDSQRTYFHSRPATTRNHVRVCGIGADTSEGQFKVLKADKRTASKALQAH